MRRLVCCALLLCMLLAGCARSAPQSAADGAAWSEDWIALGSLLGVEEPGHDLELRDNNEALSVTDMYLASWTIGEGSPYTNEDEEDVVLYPARLDVLVYGRKDADAAKQAVADWTARQGSIYHVTNTEEQTFNGQSYTISTYTCKSETNPYGRGISAFGVYKDYAISVELNCLPDFAEAEADILTDFLEGCHYAA